MIRVKKSLKAESNCFLHVQSTSQATRRRRNRVYCSVYRSLGLVRLITAEQFPTQSCWLHAVVDVESHGSLQRDSSQCSCVVPVYQAHDRDVFYRTKIGRLHVSDIGYHFIGKAKASRVSTNDTRDLISYPLHLSLIKKASYVILLFYFDSKTTMTPSPARPPHPV